MRNLTQHCVPFALLLASGLHLLRYFQLRGGR